MNTKIILAVVLAIIVVAAWAVNAHRNKGFRTVSSEEFAGLIGDMATDVSAYQQHYLMSGTYIRPFTMEMTASLKF